MSVLGLQFFDGAILSIIIISVIAGLGFYGLFLFTKNAVYETASFICLAIVSVMQGLWIFLK